MSGESEEIEFLKDQVHRLSISLTQYQKKHVQPDEPFQSGAPTVPGKKLLSPLLAEYDQTIQELNRQLSLYKAEVDSMAARIEQVTQENSRLHSELRRSLETQIQAATESGSLRLKSSGGADALDALKQQLEMVTRDRDSYQELLKKTSHELELVQRSDQDKTRKLLEYKTELIGAQQACNYATKNAEERECSCVKIEEERNRCLKTLKAQEVELSALQDKLSQAKTELRTATTKNSDLKKSLDDITFQLRKRESERVRAMDTENSLDDRLHIMQITNADLEGKLLAAQREIVVLTGEKTDLEETLSSVQARVSALEQREYEAVCHVKDSMQIAESALLEKEQATIKEQQLVNEVDRLKGTIATILNEAGERTKREVNTLREECNKNIDKMGVEIHRLEQECGECRAQLERSQREKKSVEKELEKALGQKPLEIVQTGENLHEFHKRVCVAERARDDALVKLEALTAINNRLEATLADEKQASVQLAEEHYKWRRQVEEDSQKLREEKIKSMAAVDEVKQKLRQSEQGKEAAEMKLAQELATLERRQEVRDREMAYRLEGSEKAHQKSIQELRSLLTAQHRMGTRWREESTSLAQKFEQTISDLKAELGRYKSRSYELTQQLNHLKRMKDDLGKQLQEATSCNGRLQQRLKEVEGQTEVAMEQVSQLALREKQLLQERRELNRQLDKVKLHVSRSIERPILQLNPSAFSHADSSGPFVPSPVPRTNSHGQESSQWNHTLLQLKHSIQQVKEDLGQNVRGPGLEEDDTISEHSVLSRGDLSTYSVS